MNVVFLIYHPSEMTNWVGKLAPYMESCQITVLHIAKLHNATFIPVKGVSSIEVSNYSFKQVAECLVTLRPDLFIFLGFRSVLELLFHRLCCYNHIPMVYLEHGLYSNDTLKFRTNKLKSEFFTTLKRQCVFLRLQLGYIMNSGHFWDEFSLFWQVYRKKRFSLVPYDHYFIYSQRSFDNYRRLFGMSEKDVSYIGYPVFNDDKQKKSVLGIRDDGGVLYVHQPLISDGIAHISYSDEKKWLVQIAKLLENKYGKMTILLHPRGDIDEYKKRFADTDIEIVKSPNNYRLFADKALIIGHYSTALLYGLYFNKPTIVLDFPTLKNDPLFAELFTYVYDINELPQVKVHVNADRKTYMVGHNNTFEHIAYTIMHYVDYIRK